MTDDVLTGREGAVLTLTLARPQKKNALTGAMYERLAEGLDAAERDASVGCVLLRGSGGVFTSGNDIADFLAASEGALAERPMAAFAFIRKLAAFGKPLVAAVEGPAIGIGATLCLHCDLVYAAPAAQFAMPFVKLGFVPEGGSSLIVPQRFGAARAGAMLLLGEPFSGEEAAAMGFATAAVPADALHAHALAKAEALAKQPRAALLAARSLMRGDRGAVLARIDEEGRQIRAFLASPEAKAAFQAFMARGKP